MGSLVRQIFLLSSHCLCDVYVWILLGPISFQVDVYRLYYQWACQMLSGCLMLDQQGVSRWPENTYEGTECNAKCTESKYNMMELLPVWDVILSLPTLGFAVQKHLVTCWCSWLKWMDESSVTQSRLVPYQMFTLKKLGHSRPGLHPFWWGSKGLCADLSLALQAQGILLRVFCVCET